MCDERLYSPATHSPVAQSPTWSGAPQLACESSEGGGLQLCLPGMGWTQQHGADSALCQAVCG